MKLIQALLLVLMATSQAIAQTVHIGAATGEQPFDYARQQLTESLRQSGYSLVKDPGQADHQLILSIDAGSLEPEAFNVQRGKNALVITGGDTNGVIYGAQSVAEQLDNGRLLSDIQAHSESPALAFRALKYNLPWDSYRSSSALDLHYDTVRDVDYWESFLDMMVENRFNALTLWNLHPFPYMIKPTNFPEATPFSDEELAEWRTLYQSIFRMARERGIDTYLVNWNVLVSKELADAHDLEGTNYFPYYKGQADAKGEAQTSDLVKRYTRESVTQVLEEYPDLTGFGFSFGEQMAGMTPRERQDWMDDTVIAGMQAADRPVKMIFRAPFSSDLGQGGSTDKATEELTREAIEALGDDFSGPIWMEIKFNWSHGHSTPQLVKVHGGELKDTYFSPQPKNYRVSWMVRNEDFYALRWGVPEFIRQHLALNGDKPYVGGYFVGSENYIPAKDYFTPDGQDVDWRYAFERQWLFYQLWGRLLYNPETPDRVFEEAFVRRYGETARPLLEAYSLASATQLHFASAVDSAWDFTLYGEGMMVIGRPAMQPITVDRLIQTDPLDPDYLSIVEYVDRVASGEVFADEVVTPVKLAHILESKAAKALDLVSDIDTSENLSLLHEVGDVKAWAYLGLHFAEKLRAAVAVQEYRVSGKANEQWAQLATDSLDRSLAYWDELIAITRPLYRDMPLVHYNGPNNNRNDDNLFHWALIRPLIVEDFQRIKQEIHP